MKSRDLQQGDFVGTGRARYICKGYHVCQGLFIGRNADTAACQKRVFYTTSRNRFRFSRAIQRNTRKLFHPSPVIHPVRVGCTHWKRVIPLIRKLYGTRAVCIDTPDTNRVAVMKCPGKNDETVPHGKRLRIFAAGSLTSWL